MKKAKRILSLVMMLVLVLALGTVAMAGTDYSITINNIQKGQTYAIYKVFDAKTDGTNINYTYSGEATDITGSSMNTYFAIDANKNVTIKAAAKDGNGNLNKSAVEAIATFVGSKAATKSYAATAAATSYTFSDLEAGYYYVTSTVGSAVMVNSTNKTATIEDKNVVNKPGLPTGETSYKVVSSTNTFATPASNTADVAIGATAYYKVQFNATPYDGNEQVLTYVVTDTYNTNDLKIDWSKDLAVTVGGSSITKKNAADANCTAAYYTVSEGSADASGNKTVTITLYWSKYTTTAEVKTYGESCYTAAQVVNVSYNAEVLKAGTSSNTAVITDTLYSKPTTPNPVTPSATPPQATVKNYNITINTLLKGDPSDTPLAGGQYTLGGYSFVDEGNGVYRLPKSDETTGLVSKVSAVSGTVVLKGFAPGTYTASEDLIPGYTKVADQSDTISNADITLNFVHVKGIALPTTGGMGTTLFYVLGTLMVGAAVVLFITKKRVDGNN